MTMSSLPTQNFFWTRRIFLRDKLANAGALGGTSWLLILFRFAILTARAACSQSPLHQFQLDTSQGKKRFQFLLLSFRPRHQVNRQGLHQRGALFQQLRTATIREFSRRGPKQDRSTVHTAKCK